jgi:hypothetical protein
MEDEFVINKMGDKYVMRVEGSRYHGEVPGTCGDHEMNYMDFIQKVHDVLENGDLPNSKNTGLTTCNGEWKVVKDGDEYILKRPTYLCGECDSNTKRAARILSLLLRQRNNPLEKEAGAMAHCLLGEAQSAQDVPSEALCCAVDGSHLRPLAVAPVLATASVTPENALSMLCMVPTTSGES